MCKAMLKCRLLVWLDRIFALPDFDGIEIHTKLEVNRPESFITGQEEADTELKGPTVSQTS